MTATTAKPDVRCDGRHGGEPVTCEATAQAASVARGKRAAKRGGKP